MEKRTEWHFESDYSSKGYYVVEHGGMLRTGPFYTREAAIDWFKQELDVQLVDDREITHD